MRRFQTLWLALEKFALFFSFTMNLVLLVAMLLLLSQVSTLKSQLARPLLERVMDELDALENAAIETTVYIDQPVPIRFDLPIHQSLEVVTTAPVPLRANARFTLPGGGGVINGTVNLSLPAGLHLPVTMAMTVPVSRTVTIRMQVPVSIRLGDTELRKNIQHFREMLAPFHEMVK